MLFLKYHEIPAQAHEEEKNQGLVLEFPHIFYLKAYAAGSRLLFNPALAIKALSCVKLANHDAPGRNGTPAGGADVRRALRTAHASVLCHSLARR